MPHAEQHLAHIALHIHAGPNFVKPNLEEKNGKNNASQMRHSRTASALMHGFAHNHDLVQEEQRKASSHKAKLDGERFCAWIGWRVQQNTSSAAQWTTSCPAASVASGIRGVQMHIDFRALANTACGRTLAQVRCHGHDHLSAIIAGHASLCKPNAGLLTFLCTRTRVPITRKVGLKTSRYFRNKPTGFYMHGPRCLNQSPVPDTPSAIKGRKGPYDRRPGTASLSKVPGPNPISCGRKQPLC